MKSLNEDLIYLYCLTDKIPKTKKRGHVTSPHKETEDLVDNVYFIFYLGLYAVVGKVSTDEFSEGNLKRNLAELEWIKTKVSIHEKVIETVMKNSCVIPFKFGTVFNTEDSLKTMLTQHAEVFKENLKNLRGKEEWGVKIYCDMAKLKENLIQKDNELLNLDKDIKSSSAGKAFILRKKKEELLNTIVNKNLNAYGQDSFERLKEHTVQSRINKLLPREVTEREDDMILNSVFLMKKNNVSDFVNTVEGLKIKYADKGLFFDCTGPWPPYNFCSNGS